MKIAFHPSFIHPLPPNHRFPMEKYQKLKTFCDRTFGQEKDVWITPNPMKEEWIKSTHSEQYIQKLQKGTLEKIEERKIGFPWSAQLWERERRIVQGTWELIQNAYENQSFGVNLAGGTHHAFADKGEGFCLLNDLAIGAILGGLAGLTRILILDLDVHQGNGTASILKNIPHCFTFSMHAEKTYPLHKEKSDLDIAFAPGTRDDEYLQALEEHLPLLLHEINPELILYNAGVDILDGDDVGTLKISMEGCRKRDELVFKNSAENGIPVVTTMGGGYQKNLEPILRAHENTILEAFKWEPMIKKLS